VGTLSLPASGRVYLDANPIIYTVEKHPDFGPLLQPLWQAAQSITHFAFINCLNSARRRW
jgi:hypothetical protein